jgi:mannosyl-oligosaccharide alpha-1,2-mannosidase
MTGKTEPKPRDLCKKPLHSQSTVGLTFSILPDLTSATSIINNLLFLSPKRKLLYVTDLAYETPTHIFEHLSCFLPGLLALGVHTLDLSPKDKELHLWAAEGLAYTCYMTYADQATKLGPDEMLMDQWSEGNRAGTWVHHLKEWEVAGRPGGAPPGLREVPVMGPGNRDYGARKPAYLLRPEVGSLVYPWPLS